MWSTTVYHKYVHRNICVSGYPKALKFHLYTESARVFFFWMKRVIGCVLPSISVIFERVIVYQLSGFFDSKLPLSVSEFRKKYGCQDVVLSFVEKWKVAVVSKNAYGTVLIDLGHSIVKRTGSQLASYMRMELMSLTVWSSETFSQTESMQRLKIGINNSAWSTVNKGPLQGSVLGPFIFNYFQNDSMYCVSGIDVYICGTIILLELWRSWWNMFCQFFLLHAMVCYVSLLKILCV